MNYADRKDQPISIANIYYLCFILRRIETEMNENFFSDKLSWSMSE